MIKVDFKQIKWRKVLGNGRDGREKASESPTKLIRLLEFSPKWNEKTWCELGHVGYILKGRLCLSLGKEEVRIAEGQAFVIERGEKHKAFCKSNTTVFLVGESRPAHS
jgi:hypothetical protein